MADISEWSPVDESNNQPPPNGFPEGMAPSGLNNGSRAVMGAVRRFYDQTIDGSLELPYLKLSGGTVTGTVSATEYQLSGVTFAHRNAAINYNALFDADGYDAALLLGGAASGYYNVYQAEHHLFRSNNSTITFATVSSTGLSVTASITAGSQLSAAGNITAGGQLTGALIVSTGDINGVGIVGSTVHANTTISAGTSVAAPTIAASGTLSGLNISSTNSISAGTWINAPQYRLAGVPIEFGALFSELADLRERVRALEEAA